MTGWSGSLDLDATGIGFLLETGVVDVLGVVLGLQFVPLVALVIDQVADDALGSSLLLLTA
jgi:hypothetical protein